MNSAPSKNQELLEKIHAEIIYEANVLVSELGIKKAIKQIGKALKLRSTTLLLDPVSYRSRFVQLWWPGVNFHGFQEIIRDEHDLWAITFTCDYTWSYGFGKKRVVTTDFAERALHFDYVITPKTNARKLLRHYH